MSRKESDDTVAGVLIINKHQGVTSHKIVQIIRKLYNTRRVGHTGTLDPMATGVLPVLIGRAVKASDFLTAEDKEYSAEMTLGITTDTEDITGAVLTESDEIPSPDEVIKVCQSFLGETEQIPPMYSALKIGGQKLVDIAREGGMVERAPRKIRIDKIECEKISPKVYRLRVRCSKGTYIRTLCADIGKKLGCGAVMSSLERTHSANFTLDASHTIEELENMTPEERAALVIPTESLFADLPAVNVNDFYTKLIKGGTELYQKKLRTSFEDGTLVRLRHNNSFIALGKVTEFPDGSAVKPVKLFEL